jgi:hypothetical protein
MCAMAKKVRADQFLKPLQISARDFRALCETFHILPQDRERTKSWLDEMVVQFGGWMTREKQQPDRASDHDRLKAAYASIMEVAAALKTLGPSGRSAFKASAPIVARMLAAQWISDNFPDDEHAPRKSSLPSPSQGRQLRREPLRGQKYFIEEQTLEARVQFVSRRPENAATAALKTIAEGLDRSLRAIEYQPRYWGGQKPLIHRHYFIVNLADLWVDLGREVSAGPKSQFAAFCESVASAIGWPTDGMNSAVADARTRWLHLRRKMNQ